MALRILWEQDEALILLDALLRVLNEGYPRNQAIEEVSTTLRRRAIAKGIEIDDIFRNTNGIDMQFNSMMYVLTDSEKGVKYSPPIEAGASFNPPNLVKDFILQASVSEAMGFL